MYHSRQGPLVERRIYNLSGCDRMLAYARSGWSIVELIAEEIGKEPQEVLQMAASQFPIDVFERHGDDAPNEIMNRLMQWGSAIFCGEPANAISEPRIAPRP